MIGVRREGNVVMLSISMRKYMIGVDKRRKCSNE